MTYAEQLDSLSAQSTAVGTSADAEVAGLNRQVATLEAQLAAKPPAGTPWLPVDLDYGALAKAKRRVLASWMPFFPLRLTATGSAVDDYYAKNYWTPTPSSSGESTKWAPYGGYLRDRPLPPTSAPGGQPDAYEIVDAVTEIGWAKAAGVDGFFLCLESIVQDTPRNWQRCVSMAKAAQAAGGFTVAPMPDMTSSPLKTCTPQALADACVALGKAGPLERIADGRVLVAPFMAEQRDAAFWTGFLDAMKKAGLEAALCPMLNSSLTAAAVTAILPLCWGVSQWGGRSPATVSGATSTGKAQHAAGRAWMQYVCNQDQRPKDKVWDEANNTELLRSTWGAAIDTDAELVHLATWNDYSEGSQFSPSWLRGFGFLDVSAYYLASYKLNKWATIARDAVFTSAKRQLSGTAPTLSYPNKMALRAGSSPARDSVETVSFVKGVAAPTISALPVVNGSKPAPGIEVLTTPSVQDEQYIVWSSLR